jgi:hypothetical protein
MREALVLMVWLAATVLGFAWFAVPLLHRAMASPPLGG